MTFLPILERELRVRARSRGNYWVRPAVGLVGILVALPPLTWSGPFGTTAQTGRNVFTGIISAAFVLSCAACLVTADTISGERRDGTLGLLFLTRVRHFDVLIGKLGSNGLACVLGLVALLPVLMIPVLAGGVTSGEVVREGLALLALLFLALSTGLWASTRWLERWQVSRAALLWLVGLVLGPGLLGWVLPRTGFELVSPLGTLLQADDRAYRLSAVRYWLSLAFVQLIGGLLLTATTLRLRDCGQSEEAGSITGARHADREASVPPVITGATPPQAAKPAGIKRCPYCGSRNEEQATQCYGCGTRLWVQPDPETRALALSDQPTPLHWLLRRQRGLRPMLWVAAVVSFFHLAPYGLAGQLFFRGLGTFMGIFSVLGFATSVISGSLIAWAAGRFFLEARRTGELELLLTTPVGPAAVVSAQWDVFKRLLAGPVLLMLAPVALQGLFMFSFSYGQADIWNVYYTLALMLSALNTVIGVGTLCWLAFWFGLRENGPGRTIFRTVLLATGPAYVFGFAWPIFYRIFLATIGGSWSGTPWLLGSLMPQLLTLLLSLWLIRVARRQLRRELSGTETLQWPQILAVEFARILTALRRSRDWPRV